MAHQHSHCDHAHDRPLKIALVIAAIFMVAEVIGGVIANSLALISDALHMFTDVGAILLSLIVMKIAKRPATAKMSYGYQRAEILGALASALSIWALCGVLIYEAISRLIHPHPVQGPIVFTIATIGLIANLLMMHVLHPSQGHHLNVRAAYLHVLGDLLGSIGVIASGIILWLTGWNLIDPLITLAISIILLRTSGKMIYQSIRMLMDSTPDGIDPLKIERDLLAITGVKEVHDLHVWSVGAKRIALSAHLIVENNPIALKSAHHIIEKNYEIHHMTIQVEDPLHFESRYCYDCSIK